MFCSVFEEKRRSGEKTRRRHNSNSNENVDGKAEEWPGSGEGMVKERRGSGEGMVRERRGEGQGMVREWRGSGEGMAREWILQKNTKKSKKIRKNRQILAATWEAKCSENHEKSMLKASMFSDTFFSQFFSIFL